MLFRSDTQVNESLNNTISWMAPKNKTYSGTVSLENRIGIALGIHSVGIVVYFERLLGKLGVPITDDFRHYLLLQQQTRTYRIVKSKKQSSKKNRNKKLHLKLQEYSEQVKREIDKGGGSVYNPGIGMNGGYSDVAGTKPATEKKCTSCGMVNGDHVRPWSKKCPNYEQYRYAKLAKKTTVTAVTAAEGMDDTDRDAVEQALMDEVGFEATDQEFAEVLEDIIAEEDTASNPNVI